MSDGLRVLDAVTKLPLRPEAAWVRRRWSMDPFSFILSSHKLLVTATEAKVVCKQHVLSSSTAYEQKVPSGGI